MGEVGGVRSGDRGNRGGTAKGLIWNASNERGTAALQREMVDVNKYSRSGFQKKRACERLFQAGRTFKSLAMPKLHQLPTA